MLTAEASLYLGPSHKTLKSLVRYEWGPTRVQFHNDKDFNEIAEAKNKHANNHAQYTLNKRIQIVMYGKLLSTKTNCES